MPTATTTTTYTVLRRGDAGTEVQLLQALLNNHGFTLRVDGEFGPSTESAVMAFQAKNGLEADGIVGNRTFMALRGEKAPKTPKPLGLATKDAFLPEGQYNKSIVPKKSIVLHHTAGSHRPDYTIQGWAGDTWGPVATAFVIGGKSPDGKDDSFDGQIWRAFDEQYWAYSLGLQTANRNQVESQSVGVEVCNWGFLKQTADGRFLNWVNREVPAGQVRKLKEPFFRYNYWHDYTDAQLTSLKVLILALANKFSIDVKGKYDRKWFSLNQKAINGAPGLWTHVNFRDDKSDLWPESELIDMLNSL